MTEGRPKVADLPASVDGEPGEVRTRLASRLLPLRSVWFPTPRELRAWRDAGVPLYVRILAPDRLEVGPRLQSMWAACFAPVWVGRLNGSSPTHLTWRRRWPSFTSGLLITWWAVLVVWPIVLAVRVQAGEDHLGWLPFWAFLVLASTAGPAIGWVMGGRALDEAQTWLTDALLQQGVDEDW